MLWVLVCWLAQSISNTVDSITGRYSCQLLHTSASEQCQKPPLLRDINSTLKYCLSQYAWELNEVLRGDNDWNYFQANFSMKQQFVLRSPTMSYLNRAVKYWQKIDPSEKVNTDDERLFELRKTGTKVSTVASHTIKDKSHIGARTIFDDRTCKTEGSIDIKLIIVRYDNHKKFHQLS